QVKSVMDGTWVAENYWGGLNDDVVLLTPLTKNAPDGAQAKVDEVLAKIKDGSFNIFQGPILDQTGTEKIAAGAAMSDEDQLGLMWFVKGVNGVIEQ
ncbi:MAG: BMP family ABC transporter substrate-binding protein, partial [Vallitaleaceae bacterium]|nr:BMP family ABC transporter substrate-binding protein [Vallitaleaceae bacterium]